MGTSRGPKRYIRIVRGFCGSKSYRGHTGLYRDMQGFGLRVYRVVKKLGFSAAFRFGGPQNEGEDICQVQVPKNTHTHREF